ncbi:MAG: hypothetical protein QNJ63_15165 [Calothrix sp. MO_192.B10]|nr:hypothetical protein [Calothrix sp. MO_192.B10]
MNFLKSSIRKLSLSIPVLAFSSMLITHDFHNASSAVAQTTCSTSTLANRRYGFRFQGSLPPNPIYAVGFLDFQSGSVNITGDVNNNGSLQPIQASFSYTVTPNCSLTISTAGQQLTGVIVNNGNDLFIMYTINPGEISIPGIIVAKRI